jgi:hypothetical protein
MRRWVVGVLMGVMLEMGAVYAGEGYQPDGFEVEVSAHVAGETFESSYDRKEIPQAGCLPDDEGWRPLKTYVDDGMPYSATTRGKKAGVLMGVGARAGFRLRAYHLVFLHFDYMQERWMTRTETSLWDDIEQVSHESCYSDGGNVGVVRMSMGYRFAYPVLEWLEPFAVFEGGVRWYDPPGGWTRLGSEERFTLLLGAGVRLLFWERLFASVSYLWELPLDWQTASSVMIGMGVFFMKPGGGP